MIISFFLNVSSSSSTPLQSYMATYSIFSVFVVVVVVLGVLSGNSFFAGTDDNFDVAEIEIGAFFVCSFTKFLGKFLFYLFYRFSACPTSTLDLRRHLRI